MDRELFDVEVVCSDDDVDIETIDCVPVAAPPAQTTCEPHSTNSTVWFEEVEDLEDETEILELPSTSGKPISNVARDVVQASALPTAIGKQQEDVCEKIDHSSSSCSSETADEEIGVLPSSPTCSTQTVDEVNEVIDVLHLAPSCSRLIQDKTDEEVDIVDSPPACDVPATVLTERVVTAPSVSAGPINGFCIEEEFDDPDLDHSMKVEAVETVEDEKETVEQLCIASGLVAAGTDIIKKEEDQVKSAGERRELPRKTKTLKCELCEQTFSDPSSLINHIEVHAGGLSHQCGICGAVFSRKSHLDWHVNTHTDFELSSGAVKTVTRHCQRPRKNSSVDVKQGDSDVSSSTVRLEKRPLKRDLKCDLCGEMFSDTSSLVNHIEVHAGAGFHECPECGASFSRNSLLVTHLSTHHKQQQPPSVGPSRSDKKGKQSYRRKAKEVKRGSVNLKCDICDERFHDRNRFVNHIEVHASEASHQCSVCGVAFPRKTHLDWHMNTHLRGTTLLTDEDRDEEDSAMVTNVSAAVTAASKAAQVKKKGHRVYKSSCATADKKKRAYYRWQIKPPPKTHTCDVCQKVYRFPSMLREHLKIHAGVRHKCKECGKSFLAKGTLLRHEQENHGAPRPRYPCKHCPSTFKGRDGLARHIMRRHTMERPFKCHCGLAFIASGDLNRHQRTAHSEETTDADTSVAGSKAFKCEICQTGFMAVGALSKHRNCHTGTKPFKCKECSAAFFTAEQLQQHLLYHDARKKIRFKCPHCDFTSRYNDKRHMLVHSEDRPCCCHICGKTFRHRNNLKEHLDVHAGRRPYKCTHCDYSFTRISELKGHQVVHTGVRKNKCAVCNRRFARKQELRKHLLKHTGQHRTACDLCGIKVVCMAQHKKRMHTQPV